MRWEEDVRIRKQAVVSCFKMPYRNLHGETEKNHENLRIAWPRTSLLHEPDDRNNEC